MGCLAALPRPSVGHPYPRALVAMVAFCKVVVHDVVHPAERARPPPSSSEPPPPSSSCWTARHARVHLRRGEEASAEAITRLFGQRC